MTRPLLVAATSAAVAVLCSLTGVASASALDVRITTVRASESGPSDAQLVDVRPRLRRLVGYHSYRIINDERRHCSWGNAEEFAIPGGSRLHVVPKGMREETVMMQIRLVQGTRSLVDTDVRLQNGGVMLFGVGTEQQTMESTPDGPLIIMVRAED